ncbi:hypothetical protein BDQ12DRAFT_27534 [Crucibulum laeve]|uniref:Mid2 domain-containing protein n=1 Tax=Crucibulum laeve TaxID=68775 RepID=A0A5C3MHH7_9AGAR|nr:hypothetical protein BDQ12DRAFT_27534 [Crucibulum laeve]
MSWNHRQTILLGLCALISSTTARWVDRQVHVNSPSQPAPTQTVPAVIVNGLSYVTPHPTPTNPLEDVFPETITRSGSVFVSYATITLYPVSATPDEDMHPPSASPDTTTASHSTNKGAIAGGIIGGLAVLVAAIAAFICLRRRSPRRWRDAPSRRWADLDRKAVVANAPTPVERVQNPFEQYEVKSNLTSNQSSAIPAIKPIAPLFIREKHQQPTLDPFADPEASPLRDHHRRSSSTFIGSHRQVDNIEMEVNPSSPKHEQGNVV